MQGPLESPRRPSHPNMDATDAENPKDVEKQEFRAGFNRMERIMEDIQMLMGQLLLC